MSEDARRSLPVVAGSLVGSVLVWLLPMQFTASATAGVVSGYLSGEGESSITGGLAGGVVHLFWHLDSGDTLGHILAGTDILGNVLVIVVGVLFAGTAGAAAGFLQQVVVDTPESLHDHEPPEKP
jgi:hypothetical protein